MASTPRFDQAKDDVRSKELVTVIVIFLDEARFIREAIESVFAQTHQHWELLLVDDGSRDQSTGIARSIADQHPEKIRYLEHADHQNLGMSASRNLGIRHAKGKYIAFLDADDVWLPVKLEQQLAIFRAYPAAEMVLGPVQWWYSWTGNPQDLKLDFVRGLNIQPNRLIEPPELLTTLLQKETVTSTVSLILREAIVHVGGFEETFRGLYEDQAFFAKLSSSVPIYVSNTCWYRWRKHSDSACSDAVTSGQYQAERLKYLMWLENYLSRRGILHDDLLRTLKNQIWKCRHPSLSRLRNSVQNPRWMKRTLRGLAVDILPSVCRQWLSARLHRKEYVPPVGWVRFGSFRRMEPFSRVLGIDRGLPIDRYYIEKFLSEHCRDIAGHVLEIGDDRYTRKFGRDKVVKSDVLNLFDSPQTTIAADLTHDDLPSEQFDCVICTQTLPFIYDVRAALQTLYRVLKSGGVLLATVAGGTHPISIFDMEHWGDYWRFTSLSARLLFREVFPEENLQVKTYGNVMAATAFINGLVVEDLSRVNLDYYDPNYEVVVVVRAVKPLRPNRSGLGL